MLKLDTIQKKREGERKKRRRRRTCFEQGVRGIPPRTLVKRNEVKAGTQNSFLGGNFWGVGEMGLASTGVVECGSGWTRGWFQRFMGYMRWWFVAVCCVNQVFARRETELWRRE